MTTRVSAAQSIEEAWRYFADGQLDKAIALAQAADTAYPESATVSEALGHLLKRRGDVQGAANALERACDLDPTLHEAAYALAWLLHDLGRIDEAMGWAQHALVQQRLPQRVMQVGWLLQKTERLAQAVQNYLEAIDAFAPAASEQPRLHLHLVQCLFSLGRTEQADKVLAQALTDWPQDPHLLQQGATRLQAAKSSI